MRGVDLKEPEYSQTDADEFEMLDLRGGTLPAGDARGRPGLRAGRRHGRDGLHLRQPRRDPAQQRPHQPAHARRGPRQRRAGATSTRSSACIYPEYLQTDADVVPSEGEDAYPAQPQDAYGWEKLVTERLCRYYADEYGIETRIVRFHNIYGPYGTYDGGREKAPAAMCRKVAVAEDGGSIEIWGDGEQTRSFCYIDDCVEGIYRLMQSDYASRSTSAPTDGVDQRAGQHRHRDLRQSSGIARRARPGRRACAAATPTTPGCAKSSAGSRRISLGRRAGAPPSGGSRSRSAGHRRSRGDRRCAAVAMVMRWPEWRADW